jgi:hypothetical protein
MTLAPPSMSGGARPTPRATGQFRMSKYSTEVPMIVVDQFWSSLTTGVLIRKVGAAALTVGMSRRMAARSSHVSVGSEPKPPRTPAVLDVPCWMMRTFVPIAANASSTRALAPAPIAIIVMTAPTPMTIPSVVRSERSLFRRMDRSATLRVWNGFTTGSLLRKRRGRLAAAPARSP